MPKLKLEAVIHETKQGRYVSRSPQEIADSLKRKTEHTSGDTNLDDILDRLPNIFKGNQARLLEGANLQELTFLEGLDRRIPLVDINQVPWIAGSLGLAALAWHAATYGNDPGNIYYQLNQFLNRAPDWLKYPIDAINSRLYVFKGDSYPSAVILGALSTFSLAYGIVKGLIPWRGDQILWKKSHLSEVNRKIKEGIQPYTGVGHLVGYGMRDPLAYAELNDGRSFTRALSELFNELVLIQRDGGKEGYWRPKTLGLEFNGKRMYVNLAKLLEEGGTRPEMLSHIIISGLYQAGGFLVNGQREFELFAKSVVDTTQERDRLDYALAAHTLRHATTLRNLIFKEVSELKVSVITPQFLAPNDNYIGEEGSQWKATVESNFLRKGRPNIHGVIVPELVFLNIVYEKMKEHGVLGSPIFIDAAGEEDAEGKAERCRNELIKLYQENNAVAPEIYMKKEDISKAKVSILLRSANRAINQSVNYNRFHLGHDYVFFSTTQREDTMTHIREGVERRRVSINYKQRIAELALQHLTGQQNYYSLDTLINSGQLKRLT